MAITKRLDMLQMLERFIEPTVEHMGPQFTTHEYVEKLRELVPADYAHDLTLCTLEYGFPQSLALLHKAIANKLRKSERVKVTGTKKSRNVRANRHRILVWQRLDTRRPSQPARLAPARRRPTSRASRAASPRPAAPPMTGSQLRAARLARSWTETELARRAGVSLAAVSRWERGERRITWPAYEALCGALRTAATKARPRRRELQ